MYLGCQALEANNVSSEEIEGGNSATRVPDVAAACRPQTLPKPYLPIGMIMPSATRIMFNLPASSSLPNTRR